MKTSFFFRNLYIIFFMLLTGCFECGGDQEKPKSTTAPPINIVVILDISDRLKKDGQIQRDTKIVEHIVKLFHEDLVYKHLEKHLGSPPCPHRFTFAVPEQPVPRTETSTSEQPDPYEVPSEILEKLQIRDPGKFNLDLEKVIGMNMYEFGEKKKTLLQGIEDLYKFAQEDNPYTGADIWDWFHKDAEGYLQDGFHNYIICLSDGYLKFDDTIEDSLPPGRFMEIGKLRNDPDWKNKIIPLLSTGKDFSRYNVKFVMMEINIHKDEKTGIADHRDFDIMVALWKPWLEDMGITGITNNDFKEQEALTQLQDLIHSIIISDEVK